MIIITLPPMGKRTIAIIVSVCLSVCPLTYHKPHVQISPNSLYMLPVAVARSSSDGIVNCNTLCTAGLVDDVMFLHNGVNGPESKMMHTFCQVRQVATPGARLL